VLPKEQFEKLAKELKEKLESHSPDRGDQPLDELGRAVRLGKIVRTQHKRPSGK
jgi:hypothetical protein